MDRGSGRSPSEDDETDGQARGGIQEPPESRFILRLFVVWLGLPLCDVSLDDWYEGKPSDEVSDQDRNERQPEFIGVEAPLFVDQREGLDEHEDEGIAEATEERQGEDDWLCEVHLERSDPGKHDLLGGKSFSEGNKLIRAIDVGLLSALASPLGNLIHHDCCPSFRDGQ